MADDTRDLKPAAVDTALGDMKLQGDESPVDQEDTIMVNGRHEESSTPNYPKRSPSSSPVIKQSTSQSPSQGGSANQTPRLKDEEEEEVIGGDITVTVEPGKAPKLSRKSSQKVISRPPVLYDEVPDSTEEACTVFQVIRDCIYGSKHMGSSEHDALDCDCSEQWNNGKNQACGEDSDCINRATKMECVDGDCNCGSGCQNQRFQQKQYANVSVFKTEKKGYGLRANVDLNADTFIFEYLGEVINEPTFRRRTQQYNDEGIKHFYFMSLTKHEFVDATKKGNLGRFCNHSCNPNCYVDKWVVGEKLRMGIFAERHIKAGEELVFNYNVDRYGADPQPCYCGEPNCTGFIGGKTQTDRATKLPHATIEALGIDDGDGWDTAVAKKPRKKKAGEDDEEYVNNVQPKGLDEEGVRKVMATLMQCKEKWIAVKLLSRIQRCDDDRVRNRVVQMHGYQILRTTLTTWKDDNNVILQILDILYKFPRLTRNKISDSKIEATIETLVDSEHEDVAFEAKRLLEEWSKLEVAYRIPRKKFDPNAVPMFERRNTDRSEEVTKSPATPAIVAPTGPRSNLPQRNLNFAAARPPFRRPPNALPVGWFQAQDEKGNTYYYSKSGQTTWVRPTFPAPEPPPPPKVPPKSVQTARAIQDIIDSITKPDPKTPTQSIPTGDSTPKEKKPSEKWRSLPKEKQMKLYENTLFPHIKHVMQKFSKQLPREDLKKFAKEVAKKLVASDFKNNRVEDPTKISEKQEKKVKSYVRDFFEKAVEKKKVLDKKKAEKAALNGSSLNGSTSTPVSGANGKAGGDEDDDQDQDQDPDPIVDLSPTALDAPPSSLPATPSISASGSNPDLKRKRDDEGGDGDETPSGTAADDSFSDSNKRLKEEESPPPPPPPPPAGGIPPLDVEGEVDAMMEGGDLEDIIVGVEVEESEEQRELRRQEEDLMRENEEAMALELESKIHHRDGEAEGEGKMEGVNGNGNGHVHVHDANTDNDMVMDGTDGTDQDQRQRQSQSTESGIPSR